MDILEKDRKVLRKLAIKVRDLSERPQNIELKKCWSELNDLNSDAPLILVSPENSWSEIKANWEYECEDEFLRGVEDQLRTKIYSITDIKDDSTIDAAFDINWKVDFGTYGFVTRQHSKRTTRCQNF